MKMWGGREMPTIAAPPATVRNIADWGPAFSTMKLKVKKNQSEKKSDNDAAWWCELRTNDELLVWRGFDTWDDAREYAVEFIAEVKKQKRK